MARWANKTRQCHNDSMSTPSHILPQLYLHYWLVASRWFCQSTLVFSINKTDRHNITEILLKVAFKHHNPLKPLTMSQLRGYTVVTTLFWFYFILYDIVEWFRREVISSRFPECRYNWGRIYEGVDMLMEETGVHREIHRPAASHWQTLSHNFVSSTPHHEHDSNSQCYWWYEALLL
jgi:hypothetical protein